MKKNTVSNKLFGIFIICFLACIIFPFYYELISSFKPYKEIINGFSLFPEHPTIKSYVLVFRNRNFGKYLWNSFVISAYTTLFAVLVASLAAYALARLTFRGKSVILGLVLTVSMFPQISTVSPIYIFMKDAGLRDTYMGLVIPYMTFSLPLAIWYLTTFFQQIPFELEEAAKIDGASSMQALVKVILPLAGPGTFTTAILIFIGAWNEYLYALTINTKDTAKTVPVAISTFQGQYTIPWGEIAAAIVIVVVPLITAVLILQRKIVSGLTSGAVKG